MLARDMRLDLIPQPFTADDALAAGLSPDDLRGLLRAGAVRRIVQGVYVMARLPDSLPLRAAALVRVVPPASLICRRTAAWLHGVDMMAIGAHLDVPPIEIAVPAGQTPPRRPGCRAYEARLDARDLQVVHGVSVTTPLRTATDLIRWLPRADAVVAIDAMTHIEVVSMAELVEELPRWKGERGVARAAEILSLAEPNTESPGESRLRLRIVDAGFPRPEAQIELFQDGVCTYRLDLGYRKRRKACEYDGEAHHSSAAAREHDEKRRLWLEARGWELLSVGKGEVYGSSRALEFAVGEMLGLTPRFRLPVPGWG